MLATGCMGWPNKAMDSEFNSATTAAIELIANEVLAQIDKGQSTPIVLIDGRAGSGKSTFAKALQEKLFQDGESLPRLIHMDDLYPGWEGLSAGSEYMNRFILTPLANNQTASWQNWSWVKNERSTWREFSGGTPLIIEGCGSLTERSKQHAFLSIWLEASEQTRRARWINRERHLDRFDFWAAQELDFYAREKSQTLADRVVATD
jgi:adenylate kinase family enzyme